MAMRRFEEARGGSPLEASADESKAVEKTTQDRQGDICENRHRENEPKLSAVLGNIGDAEIHSLARRTDSHGLSVEEDGSRSRGFDAEKGEADIGAARSDKASEPKHLTPVEIEGHALEYALAAEIGHRENNIVSSAGRPGLG